MIQGRKKWKLLARRALAERLSLPILATIVVSLLNLLSGSLGAYLFPATSILNRVLSEVFAFVITLVLGVFEAGLYYMFLNMARNREYSMGDLLYFFRNQPDRVIAASFVLALIAWVTSLPASIYQYRMPVYTDVLQMQSYESYLLQQMQSYETYLLLFGVGLLVKLVATMPFTLSYYLLADRPEIGGFEALRISAGMMKGHMLEYLLLQASFLPWLLLTFPTMYLSMLWTMPYMEMTNVMFYRELTGELTAQAEGSESYTNW